jgi:hypothetical protein
MWYMPLFVKVGLYQSLILPTLNGFRHFLCVCSGFFEPLLIEFNRVKLWQ